MENKQFIKTLVEQNEQLSNNDKKKYETPTLKVSFEVERLNDCIKHESVEKVSLDKIKNSVSATFEKNFIENLFFNKLEIKSDVHNLIREKGLYRAFNYVLSEWVNNEDNKKLLF